MLWLVKSDMTDPSPQDIMEFTGAKTFDEAYQTLAAEVTKRGLSRVWEEIEKPLMPIVDKMKGDGVKIDVAYLEKLGAEYHKELATIEKSIHRMAGVEFNIASPKQLGEVLFVKLGLKPSSGRHSRRFQTPGEEIGCSSWIFW